MEARAKYIETGDIVKAPSFPKTYEFQVAMVTITKHNVVIREHDGRAWCVPHDQWITVVSKKNFINT